MAKICPNFGGCRLVTTDVVVPDKDKKDNYLADYCETEEKWKSCLRYTTRKSLWICPDFVLPDSNMTEDEIVEKYEEAEKKKSK
jgi:hypothetical protein